MTDAAATLLYLDASALVKLVVAEAESDALTSFLGDWPSWVSSALAVVEVGRAARRASEDPSVHRRAEEVIAGLGLVPVDVELLHRASVLDLGGIRSLDAVHLASALSLEADLGAMVVYDRRLAEAAVAAGVSVAAPS